MAMLQTTDGQGPVLSSGAITTEEASLGVEGDYSMTTCEDMGEMKLVGGWDSNGNWLIDPMDTYGRYAVDEEVANPIEVEGTDLPGHDIIIPLGDGAFQLVHFVALRGIIRPDGGGTFDDFLANWETATGDSVIYATALKYLPNGDLLVEDFEDDAYDLMVWEPEDWTGQTQLAYRLLVPAETITYVWALVDLEPNGLVNEPDEPASSPMSGALGRYVTGTSSIDDLDISMVH
jgi:hypothetical protein